MKNGSLIAGFDLEDKYVDLNDIDNPIKTTHKSYLFGNRGKTELIGLNKYVYRVKRNEVELQDSWWDFLTNPEPQKFANLDTDYRYEHFDEYQTEFRFSFFLSDETSQFGRKLLNFLEVTGIVGGLFEVLDIFMGIVIGYVYNLSLKREIKSDLLKSEKRIQELEENMKEMLKDKDSKRQDNLNNNESSEQEFIAYQNAKLTPCIREESKVIPFEGEQVQMLQNEFIEGNHSQHVNQDPIQNFQQHQLQDANNNDSEAKK